jgi:hypothetical protein
VPPVEEPLAGGRAEQHGLRVTRGEVRVFPLHDSAGSPYPHLDRLRAALHDRGVRTELRASGCAHSPPRPGSDRMLVYRGPR